MGIQMGTVLIVADNSGPRLVKCIQILKKNGRFSDGKVGDILVVSVLLKRSGASSEIKKGSKYRALVVGTRQNLLRSDGSTYRIINGDGKTKGRRKHNTIVCNRVVLINDNNQPLGTRIFGPVPRELRFVSTGVVNISSDVI